LQKPYLWSYNYFTVFEDRDIAQINATVISGVMILAGMTTINPTNYI